MLEYSEESNRLQKFIPFSEAVHQYPELPIKAKFPYALRYPPGKAENSLVLLPFQLGESVAVAFNCAP
jgi:hypothetical protein